MRLIDAIREIEKDWPGGFNFRNKSEFLGLVCGGQLVITSEMLKSDDWGAEFRTHDKELIEMLKPYDPSQPQEE